MRLFLPLSLFILFSFLVSTSQAQSTKISLHMGTVTINEVLNKIEQESTYSFLVNQQLVDLNRKVTAEYTDVAIKDILNDIFKGEKINIVVADHQIILTPLDQGKGEKSEPVRKISGIVTDSKKHEPVPGVIVRLKGTALATNTSVDGTYSLDIPVSDGVLVFSFLGFNPREFQVSAIGNLLNVELEETAINLESVVVTALGIKREEKALGYAVQHINAEGLQTVKGTDPLISLTGKVAGLMIKNSSNFGVTSTMGLRGEDPLIVIDGIPSTNVSIDDLSIDDIKNIDVLKGSTASALYGYRGATGAIMITTNRGDKEKKGMSVSVNQSTMLSMGFVVTPKTQKSYSSGFNGKYGNDYVWGDKLDIGRTATLWDPYEMIWKDSVPLVSKGKNNLKNFEQMGMVTNTNVNIVNQGEHGNFRTSMSHIYNRGSFPNQKLEKFIYTIGGDISYNNLNIESNFTYSKHISPNIRGSQYSGGYLYNLIGWLGAEWDLNEYKNYWMVKDEKQNWFNEEWYDNPYFLANEVLETSDRDIFNGFVSATYKITPWLKLSYRTGLDSYLNRFTYRNPISARNAYSYDGYYEDQKYTGYSINNDLLLMYDKKFKNIRVEGLFGGTIYYYKNDYFDAYTKGGISIPGYYSLKASKDPIGWDSWIQRRQVNSFYNRTTISYKSLAYLDLTGRWDWSSTLSSTQNPYFYPSVAGSLVLSEFMAKQTWLDLWKIRGSWTMSKDIPGVYDINSTYTVNNEVWGGFNSAYYPSMLNSLNIRPQSFQTIEIGTAAMLFKNRAHADVAVYRKRMYDYLVKASLSQATGFDQKYLNSSEEHLTKGIELTLGGTPVQTKDWKWDINANWSKNFTIYSKVDKQYSEDKLWVKEGARVDAYTTSDWLRDPSGNLINNNGFPVRSDYQSVIGYTDPDWIWGLSSSLKYKSFTLEFAFDGRAGGLSFSRLDALLLNSGADYRTDNQWRYDEVVNGNKNYIGPGVKVVSGTVEYDTYGRITSDTRVYAPNDVEVSYESYTKDHYQQGAWSWCSQNILDETFIKLREVALTYKIPSSLSNKIHFKDTSISVIGQNLFYWGKEYKQADPDFSEGWDLVSPSMRYVGIDLKFNI